jgi:hypothetical protein
MVIFILILLLTRWRCITHLVLVGMM